MRFPSLFTRWVGTAPTGAKALGTADATLPTGKPAATTDNLLESRFANINGWPIQRLAFTYRFVPTVPAGVTIAVGSNGATLPQATIHVSATTGFPPGGGTFTVDGSTVAYTGLTSTTFTGCTGGTATLATGDAVAFATATAPSVTARVFFYEDASGGWHKIGADVTVAPAVVSFFDVIALLELPNTNANMAQSSSGSVTQFFQVDLPANAPNGQYIFSAAPDLTSQA